MGALTHSEWVRALLVGMGMNPFRMGSYCIENGQEAKIVRIDFSAAFYSVNHLEFCKNSVMSAFEVLCCLY